MSVSVCGAVMSAGYTLAADAKALYYMLGLSGRVREQVQRHHSLLSFLFSTLLYSYFISNYYASSYLDQENTAHLISYQKNVCVLQSMLRLTSSHQITHCHYSSVIFVN